MNITPKVSIVLTSFNHEKYIRESIDTVLAQAYENFELIIWDDASTDQSWSIINSYSDTRIKVFHNQKNRGPVYGINKAIAEVASGEYIAIHHSDDVWASDKLEKQVLFLDNNPKIGAVFTNALAIGEDSQPLNDPAHFYSTIFEQPNRTRYEWLNHFFYKGNALCHPSVLIRRQCYNECGLYRYGLSQLPDFDMWIRLCFKYEIHVLPERLVHFRVRAHEANTSGNRPEVRIRVNAEFYNILKNFLQIDTFEEIVAIFPRAQEYYRPAGCEPKFVLSMMLLRIDTFHFSKPLGIELLFDLMDNAVVADRIKSLYAFDYLDLIKITGKHDVFSIEATHQLNCVLSSKSWKITRPLRWLGSKLKPIPQDMA